MTSTPTTWPGPAAVRPLRPCAAAPPPPSRPRAAPAALRVHEAARAPAHAPCAPRLEAARSPAAERIAQAAGIGPERAAAAAECGTARHSSPPGMPGRRALGPSAAAPRAQSDPHGRCHRGAGASVLS
jgi:hypothetical protein